MDTIFMTSKNSKTSHVLILMLEQIIEWINYWWIGNKY